jgi:ligand-binding SRPBCC domain-containing protein
MRREQYMPITIEKAWDFFSSPANLSRITPPGMGITIQSKQTEEPIYTGMKIKYIIKPLFNIPLKWITEITWVMAPVTFIDKQQKGPYAFWEHTHTFTQAPGGVKMTDEVLYALPLGILGRIMHYIIVKRKLENIFNYRKSTLEKIFGKYGKP